MSADEHELRAAWSRCVEDSHDAWVLFDSLISRHREAHRHYHGVRHVTWVVRHVEELAAAEPVGDIAAVVVAAFFHDAVYDPRATDNEAASARLADRELAVLGWDDVRRERVAAMVEATAMHDVPTETAIETAIATDTAVLLDADLAVLGSDPASYQAYVRRRPLRVRPRERRRLAHRPHPGPAVVPRPAGAVRHADRPRPVGGQGTSQPGGRGGIVGRPHLPLTACPSTLSQTSALDHRQTVELLQALIRNECVNDGTPDSGGEARNADLLQTYLEGAGLDVERFEARPGRGVDRRPHRGLRPVGAHAVPHGPHRRRAREPRRLVARPVRRRA